MRRLICLWFGHKWETNETGHIFWASDRTLYCVRCRRMFDVG